MKIIPVKINICQRERERARERERQRERQTDRETDRESACLMSRTFSVEALWGRYREAHTPSSVPLSNSFVCPPARMARHWTQPLRDVRDVTASRASATAVHPSARIVFPLIHHAHGKRGGQDVSGSPTQQCRPNNKKSGVDRDTEMGKRRGSGLISFRCTVGEGAGTGAVGGRKGADPLRPITAWNGRHGAARGSG